MGKRRREDEFRMSVERRAGGCGSEIVRRSVIRRELCGKNEVVCCEEVNEAGGEWKALEATQ